MSEISLPVDQLTTTAQSIVASSQEELDASNWYTSQLMHIAQKLPMSMQDCFVAFVQTLQADLVAITTLQSDIGKRLALNAQQAEALDAKVGQGFTQ